MSGSRPMVNAQLKSFLFNQVTRFNKAQGPLISCVLRDSRFEKRAVNMSDFFWLSEAQMGRLQLMEAVA